MFTFWNVKCGQSLKLKEQVLKETVACIGQRSFTIEREACDVKIYICILNVNTYQHVFSLFFVVILLKFYSGILFDIYQARHKLNISIAV